MDRRLIKGGIYWKNVKKGKDESSPMIYEIDFSSMENKMKSDLGRFSSLIKDIKFGKLTPETFQNILIHHYGKE